MMTGMIGGRPAASQVRRAERLYELDGLRIVAALAVVGFHYTFSGPLGGLTGVAFPAESVLTRYGYLGVDLFFMISGFVILLSAWGRRPGEFVVSRVVRLYPAYWAAVTLTAAVTALAGGAILDVSVVQYLANLTMLNAVPDIPNVDVVYWTLWAELRFYLLIMVLLWVGISARRVTWMLWLWLGCTIAVQAGALPPVLDLLVQSQFSHYFIAGMALGLGYRCGLSGQLGAILAIAFGNAVYRGAGYAEAVGLRYGTEVHPAVVVALIATFFGVLTLIALRATRRYARPWLAIAGALTYPLYLVHAHLGFVIFHQLGGVVNRHLLLAGTVALMLLIGYAVHVWVERPVAPWLRRKLRPLAGWDRLAGRDRPVAPVAAPPD